MGDHTETFQVDFDPTVISYAQLLQLFWQSHNPQRDSWSRQYMAVILYHDEMQQEQAERSKAAVMAATNQPVKTKILPLTQFYLAEEYHQKFYLQKTPLMQEMNKAYRNQPNWIDSTAAARLNGYLSGYGMPETFVSDIKQLGLSAEGQRYLQKNVDQKGVPLTCPLPNG